MIGDDEKVVSRVIDRKKKTKNKKKLQKPERMM